MKTILLLNNRYVLLASILTLCICLGTPLETYGQVSVKSIGLEYGAYAVGYNHNTWIDSTRTYSVTNDFSNKKSYRPISASVWYPHTVSTTGAEKYSVLDYLQILKKEEEWQHLPDRFLLDWFPYLWNTPDNQEHLTESTYASHGRNPENYQHPLVIYTASYESTSIENFALCEYLASHGFVVIAIPSRGTHSLRMEGGVVKDMETQFRDVNFVLQKTYSLTYVDPEDITLIGYSFGGMSNMLTAMNNDRIQTIISLDGTERYNYTELKKSSFFNKEELNAPYLHFAQKDIPKIVLEEENIPDSLNHSFEAFDSLNYCDIYRFKTTDLSHNYFSSFNILFANRDSRQDKPDERLMYSYRKICTHILNVLQHDKLTNSDINLETICKDFAKNNHDIISLQIKRASESAFNLKSFNDIAKDQEYEDLISLYESLKSLHPDLELPEYQLNTLGLRLTFDPNTSRQGINVLLLATHLYPSSSNLFDSLAESYLHINDTSSARTYFKKSLQLDPKNQNARQKLDMLN